MSSEHFFIGMGEADLSGCGGRLFFLKLKLWAGEAQMPAPYRYGARRDDQHFLAAFSKIGDVVGQGLEPITPYLTAFLIDKQR